MRYANETHQRILNTLKRIHTDLKGDADFFRDRLVTDLDAFEELIGIHNGITDRSGIYLEVLILQDEFITRDNQQDQLEMLQGLKKIEAHLNKINVTEDLESIMLLLRNTAKHFTWLTDSYMPEWGVQQ
tara:strand:- start:55 stop:441 length:387 start_codon:yes stop_codon:yes gene_type:complete